MAQEKKKPKHIRLGHITATVFTNTTEKGAVWFNVEVTRSYKDGDAWKDATTFRRDDLPIVALAVVLAYDWIWRQTVPAEPDSEA